MNSVWETKKVGRHTSAFMREEVVENYTQYLIKAAIHSKTSPDMGGNDFSWQVSCGNLNIGGSGHTLEKCKTFVDIAIPTLIRLYNTLYY